MKSPITTPATTTATTTSQHPPLTQQHSQQLYNEEDDDMDQVVTNNAAVDYNTNDSKYMYDDFTENDYIATGDIVTTSTVTSVMITQTRYTNSYTTDATNILNDQYLSDPNQIGTLNGQLPEIPDSQNTLSNHKANLYCDNTAYDLIDVQHPDDDDESNKIGNNNYLRDHMYNDRYIDTSGNIIFNQPVSSSSTNVHHSHVINYMPI